MLILNQRTQQPATDSVALAYDERKRSRLKVKLASGLDALDDHRLKACAGCVNRSREPRGASSQNDDLLHAVFSEIEVVKY